MSRRRCPATVSCTASRAISWRNLNPALSPASSPAARSSSTAGTGQPVTDSSSGNPGRPPISAAASSTSRAFALSRDMRATTASRADTGISPIPDCTTSVT